MKKFITILAAAMALCGACGAYAADSNVTVEKKERVMRKSPWKGLTKIS